MTDVTIRLQAGTSGPLHGLQTEWPCSSTCLTSSAAASNWPRSNHSCYCAIIDVIAVCLANAAAQQGRPPKEEVATYHAPATTDRCHAGSPSNDLRAASRTASSASPSRSTQLEPELHRKPPPPGILVLGVCLPNDATTRKARRATGSL